MSNKDKNLTPGGRELMDKMLMPPPPPRDVRKRKEIVLDEDDWTSKIEAIIERDYFPELGKLQDKVRWLEAVRSGDPEQIRLAQVAIAQRRAHNNNQQTITPGRPLFTPGGTVARADQHGPTPRAPHLTPAYHNDTIYEEDEEDAYQQQGGGIVDVPNMSLDSFLAQHTSEDDDSFGEILETENKRRREKAEARLKAVGAHTQQMLITEGREKTDGFGTSGQQPVTLRGWQYNPKNMLMYDGGTKDPIPYSKKELSAMVEGPPKTIATANTRFKPTTQATDSGSATPASSTDTDNLLGNAAARDINAKAVPVGARGGPTGTIGYNVLATPSFDPGVDASPFVTWGDIEATPMRIEAEDLPAGGAHASMQGPGFKINPSSAREVHAHKLAGKAAAALTKRGSATGRGGSYGGSIAGTPLLGSGSGGLTGSRRGYHPTPGSSVRGSHNTSIGVGKQRSGLSSAARKLASNLKNKKDGGDLGMSLRASYSGMTPGRRHGSGSTPSAAAEAGGWTPAGH